MSQRQQITIRSVKTITYDRLNEVRQVSRIPLGTLLDQAVEFWWHSLPEEEHVEPSGEYKGL